MIDAALGANYLAKVAHFVRGLLSKARPKRASFLDLGRKWEVAKQPQASSGNVGQKRQDPVNLLRGVDGPRLDADWY